MVHRARLTSRRLLGIAIAGCVCALALAAGAPRKGLPVYVPDPTAPGAARLADGAVFTLDAPEYGARLALLDAAARQRYLREHTGTTTDPFASRPDRPAGFLTFLLALENRGDASLYFQPLRCALVTREGEVRTPLDLASIQASFEMLDQEMPPSYASLEKVLLEKQVVLTAGGRVSGLLAFRAGDLVSRSIRLEVAVTGADGRSMGFEAPYRRVRPKEKGDTR